MTEKVKTINLKCTRCGRELDLSLQCPCGKELCRRCGVELHRHVVLFGHANIPPLCPTALFLGVN